MKSTTSRAGKRGATIVEYSLLAGLISVVAIGAVAALGNQVDETFSTATSALSSSAQAAAGNEAAAISEQLSAVTFRAGAHTDDASISYEGWHLNHPAFGTMTTDNPGIYALTALFSTNTTGYMKLTGDQTAADFSDVELICDQGRWPVSVTTTSYNASKDYTIFTWPSSAGPIFVTDTDYACSLERNN
jgi:pilus assembly protein Flp/PilA